MSELANHGQVWQDIGKATIELKEGKHEAVINRLLPYLTRADISKSARLHILELYKIAIEKLLPERYEWVTEISKSRILYIAVPSTVPLEHGQKVKVIVEVIDDDS